MIFRANAEISKYQNVFVLKGESLAAGAGDSPFKALVIAA